METEKKARPKFFEGYTLKIFSLVFMVLLLLIPVFMVRGTIDERSLTAKDAENGIMEAWGSELVATGPFIVIPGYRTETIRTKTEKDGEKIETVRKPFRLVIAPQKLNIKTNFKTEIRKRGIFSVPLFLGELGLSGSFNPAAALSNLRPNEEVFFEQAELVITLSNQKGIRKIERAVWDSNELFFLPGNQNLQVARYYNHSAPRNSKSDNGIYAKLPSFTNEESNFDISIAIQGGRLMRVFPAGQDTHVEVATDWASPSFQGSFLPSSSNITDSGFDAVWDISYLSRDIPLFWISGESRSDYGEYLFGVDFFRAIDTYSLNTRAVKYAILFLIVPFLTLFLFEMFTKKRIHSVPYLLSGIANIVFYLLLLSLSEQMHFYLAYIIAAVAVVVLLTLYSRALLPSWNKSWYMGLVLSTSYILLYAVLNAESYALLIGSISAFAVVALVMYITRKLDWYGGE